MVGEESGPYPSPRSPPGRSCLSSAIVVSVVAAVMLFWLVIVATALALHRVVCSVTLSPASTSDR